MHKLLVIAISVALAGITWYRGTTAPQFRDFIADQGFREVAALVDGSSLPASPEFGPQQSNVCGIVQITHHPDAALYFEVLAAHLGCHQGSSILLGISLATGIMLAVVGFSSGVANLAGISLILLGALFYAPGYYSWLTFPVEHTWATSCVFLLAAASVAGGPLILFATAFFTAWMSIDLVCLHVAVVAGVLVTSRGFSRRTVFLGVSAILGYVLANVVHVLQVWCHFHWDWSQVWSNYFTDYGITQSSLMFRVTYEGWSERWAMVGEWVPAYSQEVIVNSLSNCTRPAFWWMSLAGMALMPRTAKGIYGVAVFVLGVAMTPFVVPGLIFYHLHYLPRYLVLVPIVAAVILAVGSKVDFETSS